MADIRMYVQKGCPNCEAADKFLKERGVLVETIEIGFDPILQAGIRALSTNGQGLGTPIIVSFLTQEALTGYDPIQLQRIADSISSYRSIASNSAS